METRPTERRPRDDAIEYEPRQENPHPRMSREWFLFKFRDLRDRQKDMKNQWMKKEDYPRDDTNEVATARYEALRSNKRTVAWFQGLASFAEMAADQYVADEQRRRQIKDLASSLLQSIDAGEPTTDAQVSLGDTILSLCIEALEERAA